MGKDESIIEGQAPTALHIMKAKAVERTIPWSLDRVMHDHE